MLFGLATGAARADEDVMIVFDGSNSMWGQIDGEAKIDIARRAMDRLLGDWTENASLGLMAYGHRRAGDCGDIETLVDPATDTRDAIRDRIDAITPRGKTPLTTAIEQAAETLSYRDNPATVVLISDGIESCERDPCALADTLARRGVGFTAHVVGFGLGDATERAALSCIAENTGGRFVAASDAEELGEALGEVAEAVAEAAAAPEPEPVSIDLDAPDTAQAGADFEVSWSETPNPSDRIVMVPEDGADDAAIATINAGDATTGTFTAPETPGQYALRYILAETGEAAGSDRMAVTGPEIKVSAPQSAPAGSRVKIEWSESLNTRDLVTIVPKGTDEGEHWDYDRVGNDTASTLTAPSDPGLYEARYIQNKGGRTLAATSIEVVDSKVTLSGPDTTDAGSRFEVSWTGNVNGRDYVTIVPIGADAGTYTNYERVKENSGDMLMAPSEPGLYELRYVLDKGGRTLATAPIEVTEPTATISGPETTDAGSRFEVSWTGNIDGRDYVTIVPIGADAGAHTNYKRVKENFSDTLTAPSDPGLYELRYVLDHGSRTLATAPIEVTQPEMSASVPETIRVGDPLEVSWQGNVPDGRDYVTIVPAGTADNKYGDYERVKSRRSATLETPGETGLYEVRYVLDAGSRVLARAQVEIVPASATLNKGGTLDAPKAGAPGETVEVTWSVAAPNGRERVTLARADQAAFTWIDAKKASEEPTLTFDLPSRTGSYEFRLLDLAEQKVLSRARIEVQ